MKHTTYRRFGVEQSFGERVCNKFVQLVVIVALVLGFFVSGTRSAHAGEYVSQEEKAIGPAYLHKVVACDTLDQVIDQAHELERSFEERRPIKQIEGCGMMRGGVPAMVYAIGTLTLSAVELTVIRYETVSAHGDQYGWLANVKELTSI